MEGMLADEGDGFNAEEAKSSGDVLGVGLLSSTTTFGAPGQV
jgi:hypothetical protein